jgi:hypothetical protein
MRGSGWSDQDSRPPNRLSHSESGNDLGALDDRETEAEQASGSTTPGLSPPRSARARHFKPGATLAGIGGLVSVLPAIIVILIVFVSCAR